MIRPTPLKLTVVASYISYRRGAGQTPTINDVRNALLTYAQKNPALLDKTGKEGAVLNIFNALNNSISTTIR